MPMDYFLYFVDHFAFEVIVKVHSFLYLFKFFLSHLLHPIQFNHFFFFYFPALSKDWENQSI